MDAFYEEDECVLGHAADPYHRLDSRDTSRTLEVRLGDTVIARSEHPVVLYEAGFAPRWYVPRADIDETRLRPAYREVDRIGDLVSFEADKVEVRPDGERLRLEPGQAVVSHGIDRGLDADEVKAR
ncbi:DUF427 domain-containing protein [Streptomyces sp. NPDC052301]|uniref:DUF427 domain-containing protein n=1 Tax=Streptomyces sp. NPDC052301 TaxID=3365687 RepID=UPI0037D84013